MPLRFILAPDSFKESMTAEQACSAMQRGITRIFPDAHCIHVPMADGGEGTVDTFIAASNGQAVQSKVTGPLASQHIRAYFALIDQGKTAVIEMAQANGIHLLDVAQRNPLFTSTFGTGEMIKAALDLGVTKIIVGLGGSVTNDAGAGMAQALGARFLDVHHQQVALGAAYLKQIKSIDLSRLDLRLQQTKIIIASDVSNPLCGENGASFIFGPQKGATAEMVQQLDDNLGYFADLVSTQMNKNVKDVAGAGAAGGLGFGLMVFAGAHIRSGIELVIEQTKLAEKIAQADYVLTGEGKIDHQTQYGKTPFGVAQVAKQLNKPVIAFAGIVGDGIDELYDVGFTQIIGINPPDCTLVNALQNAAKHLEEAVVETLSNILRNEDEYLV